MDILSLLSFSDSYCLTLMVLQDLWKGPYQVLLTTNTAAKLEGLELWAHISQLKKAPPDICSCGYIGDLQIQLTRKGSSQHSGRLVPPRQQIKTSYFN